MLSRMKQSFLPAVLVLLLVAGCKSNQQAISPSQTAGGTGAAPRASGGSFDFYLLNLSWSPEYCHSHPTAAECATHATFVLHGLWPENNDGTYPENCSLASGPTNPSQYKDIYPDPALLEHEWMTHGTCSGLDPDTYFATARNALHSVQVPAKLGGLTAQISLPPDQIVNLFTDSNSTLPQSSIRVSCGNNYLTAVEVCLDKSLHPTACGAVRSCRARTVKIPPP